jgi:hypothetical protein
MKKILIVSVSLFAVGGVAVGIQQAMQSKLFIVKTVTVQSSVSHPPLEQSTILRLAAVPVGKESLFRLNLTAIEKRILSSDWVQEVRLQKRLLHTLVISVVYREPCAIVQTAKGNLSYVDSDGKIFGSVNTSQMSDLPLLSGFQKESLDRMKEALLLLKKWEGSPLSRMSLISSLVWDSERGYRLLVTYSLNPPRDTSTQNFGNYSRTMIDLGHEVDANLDEKLHRLVTVLRYLSGNSIAVRQVWADAGKKIVVKTARGS